MRYAQQYESLLLRSSVGCCAAAPLNAAPCAWKPGSGTCTQEAPAGDQRYTRLPPVHATSRGSLESHAVAVTGLRKDRRSEAQIRIHCTVTDAMAASQQSGPSVRRLVAQGYEMVFTCVMTTCLGG